MTVAAAGPRRTTILPTPPCRLAEAVTTSLMAGSPGRVVVVDNAEPGDDRESAGRVRSAVR